MVHHDLVVNVAEVQTSPPIYVRESSSYYKFLSHRQKDALAARVRRFGRCPPYRAYNTKNVNSLLVHSKGLFCNYP